MRNPRAVKRNRTSVPAIRTRTATRMKTSKWEKAIAVLPTRRPRWENAAGKPRTRVAVDRAGQALEDDQQADGHDDRVQLRLAVQRADEDALGHRTEGEADRQHHDEGPPVPPAPREQAEGDERGQHASGALGEVDDARRPVDQDEGKGQGGVDHPVGDAVERVVEKQGHGTRTRDSGGAGRRPPPPWQRRRRRRPVRG